MALCRSNFQISCSKISNSKIFIDLIDNAANSGNNTSCVHKKYFSSWFRKKEENKPVECKTNIVQPSSCRKRVPECPTFICSHQPSKCLEEGYGKPILPKKKPWFRKIPLIIKEKPSNCPPKPCPRELTFREYIMGPDAPLPDPKTCRMAYKYQQMCNAEDPRLDDGTCQSTKGDVLICSEPCKLSKRPKFTEPQPKPPPPYRPPNAVICKRVSDTLAGVDSCYCACVPPEDPICQSNLCPVHSKPFRLPYEEMRPENPRRKFFTCDRGISSDDVVLPPRREACTCTSAFPEKPSFPPSPETCALQETIGTNVETLTTQDDPVCRKMSRCEMLQLLMTTKNTEINLPVITRKTVTGCESRCNCDSLVPLQKGP